MNIPEINAADQRSINFVFVPFCLVCQAFQADGIVRYGYPAIIKPIVEELIKNDINIVQLPCPESNLGGYEKGLKRKPKSIEQYNTTEFRQVCQKLAFETLKMIKAILSNNYKIIAILGIEYSPSCSVGLQYSSKGTTRQPGIFIEILKKELDKEKIKIPFLGINRRGINRSLNDLKSLLNKSADLF